MRRALRSNFGSAWGDALRSEMFCRGLGHEPGKGLDAQPPEANIAA
jgi:hypothetical protein